MKRVYFFGLFALLSLLLSTELLSRVSFAQTAGANKVTVTKASPTPVPMPAPTIREEDIIEKVETELVNLSVRVVDRNNRPINNLTEPEFKIFEDNVPQKIEFFSKSEVPTNYSLVIDNSGSLRSQIDEVIEAGKILVGANKPEDETSVIRFVSSDKIEILQDFTSSKQISTMLWTTYTSRVARQRSSTPSILLRVRLPTTKKFRIRSTSSVEL